MNEKKFNFFIGIPSATHVENECIQSVFNAAMVKDARINSFRLHIQRGYLVDDNRNQIVKAALDSGADYVIMIDSDTVIPETGISQLLDIMLVDPEIKMVAGWQHRKLSRNGETETFVEDGERDYIKRYNESEIVELGQKSSGIEIKGTGFGFVMIDLSAIKEMFDRNIVPFKYVVYDAFKVGSRLSEDNYFCSVLKRELKYKIICALHVKCGHIWKEVF